MKYILKRITGIVLFLLGTMGLFAQAPDTAWTKTFRIKPFQQGIGESVQQTNDGGYIITGSSDEFLMGDTSVVFLLKTDSLGNRLWVRTFGGYSNYHEGYSVQQTPDGGYIIAGYEFFNSRCDVYLVRTDSLGDSLWIKTLGGEHDQIGTSIQKTMDGGYIITGEALKPGKLPEVYLIKLDSLGDSLWARTYGSSDYFECGWEVEQTSDGGYIIVGKTGFPDSLPDDVYLIKTDSLGDSLWAKTFGGSNSDRGYSVKQTADGGYIIAGETRSSGSGKSDIYLIKTDSLGDSLWARTYGCSDYDEGTSVLQTADGGYIITGSYCYNAYLIKTDSYGDTLWTKNLSGYWGGEVKQTADGGFIVTGQASGLVVYLVKVNQEAGIEQEILPDAFSISGCNPNPFSDKTTLSYELHEKCNIDISVYNILGQKVKKLESGIKNPGIHTITWNGTNNLGEKLCCGVYILIAKAGEKQITEKLVIFR